MSHIRVTSRNGGPTRPTVAPPPPPTNRSMTLGPDSFHACSSRMTCLYPTFRPLPPIPPPKPKRAARTAIEIDPAALAFTANPYRGCEKELTAQRDQYKLNSKGRIKRAWTCLTMCFSPDGGGAKGR